MLAQAPPAFGLLALLPEIVLLVAGCAVLLVGQSRLGGLRRSTPWWTLGAIVVGVVLLRVLNAHLGEEPDSTQLIGGGLQNDFLAFVVRMFALTVGVLLTLVAWHQAAEDERGEFLAMMLLSLGGLMLVGLADNLVVLFMALELVSVPTYIMIVLSRKRVVAAESGTKYFFLGAMAAAVMAYGMSFIYGVSGTASLSGSIEAVTTALSRPGTLKFGLATLGIVLTVGGLLFKIAAVPLHFYIADVYEGAASPVAGFLGFVPKLAGFVAIFKIIELTGYWESASVPVYWLLWAVAVASMTTGNLLALRQTNIKRLLAYSGIAHSGYMLVGVLAGPSSGGVLGDGVAAVLYYATVYGIANLGAFALLALLRVRGEACETLRDVAGLLRRHPGLALLMALAMFTLMGLPPTPGFWGKVALFGSALAAGQDVLIDQRPWVLTLVIIAVLNSALAAAYYLRVIAAVLLYENDEPAEAAPREAQQIGAVMCGFLLLAFMFYPTVLLNLGQTGSSVYRPAIESVSPDFGVAQRDVEGAVRAAISPVERLGIAVPAPGFMEPAPLAPESAEVAARSP